jgi:membrane protein YdbS with pleckstrin-like domain
MIQKNENELVLQLPDISTVPFQKIDKKYFKVLTINFFTFFSILLIGLFLLHKFAFSEKVNEYITYISFLVLFGYIFGYLLLSFPKKQYAVREKDISYKYGLFTKKMTTVPFSRIQHVEIDEKPISRLFGLSSLSVYTAGDSSDDLEIKGIQKEVALKIKEFITIKIDE